MRSPHYLGATSSGSELDSGREPNHGPESWRVVRTALITLLSALTVCAMPSSAGGGGVCEIEGTEGRDVLRGTPSSDVICGLGGNDIIRGLDGPDWLIGGKGRDRIIGGDGEDQIQGGQHRDYLAGRRGRDLLEGENRIDRHLGGRGRDCIDASEQDHQGGDVIYGGPNDDRVIADPGDVVRSADEVRRCSSF
jgi:RTX calcium-binding nonapeptide repeat (4 copies)